MVPSEIETMEMFEDALSKLDDHKARARVIRWAWDKFVQQAGHPSEQLEQQPFIPKTRSTIKKKSKKERKKTQGSSARPSIEKDLNLRPKGKKDFMSFVGEKEPKNDYEKCTIATYYLKNELEISEVSINHIYTCYKTANWRLPSNFQNALALTAHRKGWLDTGNIRDIKVTAHGENLVVHDLPRQEKKKQ